MARKVVTCTVNGKHREYFIDVRSSLSDMLRGQEGLDSVKHGCDVGECGACTVLIDEKPFNACIYLAIWAEGKRITTLEGLSDGKGAISDIQQAFIDEGAVQCGFCTPGFIMASIPILESETAMSREEIRRLCLNVWASPAVSPGGQPPSLVRILTKRSRRSTLPVLTAKPHSIRPGRTRPEEKTYHRGEGEGEPGAILR